MSSKGPLVGVICDRRLIGSHPFHVAGEKYLMALLQAAEVFPMALPVLGNGFDPLEILDRLDGLFLTGSPSNMEPRHYGGPPSPPETWQDPERDEAALRLIPEVIAAGIPLFAVCRGFEEMNVAFGGTLHQKVHEVPGLRIHRENPDDPLEKQYAPSHGVTFEPGGHLARITGRTSAMVNSLHSQAVQRLGEGLIVEARADDGLIEAFSVERADAFALGVQWHPEWQVLANEASSAIFRAFGAACRERHDSRNTRSIAR